MLWAGSRWVVAITTGSSRTEMNISSSTQGAGGTQWPDRDQSALTTRRDRADADKVQDPRQAPATTARTTAVTPLTEEDFELALRLGPNAPAPRSLDQLMSLPKVERNPWTTAGRKPADNPYDRIMGSLRMAAMRRDAAAAVSAEPAADEAVAATPAEVATTDSVATTVAPTTTTRVATPTATTSATGDTTTAADTTVGGDTATGTETATGADTTTGGDTSTGGTTTTGGTTGHPKKKPGHL